MERKVRLLHLDAVGKGRCCHILTSLSDSIGIHIHSRDLRLWKPLSHHQRNETRSRSDIKDVRSPTRPCPQQTAVGAYFHGTTLLMHSELSELKITVTHSEW